jgi:hypothetical protein
VQEGFPVRLFLCTLLLRSRLRIRPGGSEPAAQPAVHCAPVFTSTHGLNALRVIEILDPLFSLSSHDANQAALRRWHGTEDPVLQKRNPHGSFGHTSFSNFFSKVGAESAVVPAGETRWVGALKERSRHRAAFFSAFLGSPGLTGGILAESRVGDLKAVCLIARSVDDNSAPTFLFIGRRTAS